MVVEPSHISTARSFIPPPAPGERPTEYADRIGEYHVATRSEAHRKQHGLYLTPVTAADFMAAQIQVAGDRLRVLDPAAGAGILCCAAVEALAERRRPPGWIELVAYEVDAELMDPLQAVLDYLREWCREKHGISLEERVESQDFVLAHAETLRREDSLIPCESDDRDFDIAISNPPYFKINKSDPRAVLASSVVYGQPNIYALFMAVSAALVRPGGDFISITPRSFTSGLYFRQFRRIFFDLVQPTLVHAFGSRREAFKRDEVLQENVILHGTRLNSQPQDRQAPLVISSSRGVGDLDDSDRRTTPLQAALDLDDRERVLRLPVSEEDARVLDLVDSWPNTLASLGLGISTGPVVPFRAKDLVEREGQVPELHVPLLWMNHVRPMQVTWPLNRHKPEYIKRQGAEKLLLPNRNYVLLRRFTAKEEVRRLSAAPYVARSMPVPLVGLENHLNYIYRQAGSLTDEEAWGLAALYNSRLLDTYFRCLNGHTQVNATELRAMPLPANHFIVELGERVQQLANPIDHLDPLIADTLSADICRKFVVEQA
ncbi:MAG: methyltransferase [Holophagales bacterium]|nr:methyltransferase [Holophagales bacterium]MYH24567.1 methyltransferase [Holophagales bacterium]